jgi:hypothetical protein
MLYRRKRLPGTRENLTIQFTMRKSTQLLAPLQEGHEVDTAAKSIECCARLSTTDYLEYSW